MVRIYSRRAADRNAPWRECLECGNRFQVKRLSQKWYSAACQTASFREHRHDVASSWTARVRWYIR